MMLAFWMDPLTRSIRAQTPIRLYCRHSSSSVGLNRSRRLFLTLILRAHFVTQALELPVDLGTAVLQQFIMGNFAESP